MMPLRPGIAILIGFLTLDQTLRKGVGAATFAPEDRSLSAPDYPYRNFARQEFAGVLQKPPCPLGGKRTHGK